MFLHVRSSFPGVYSLFKILAFVKLLDSSGIQMREETGKSAMQRHGVWYSGYPIRVWYTKVQHTGTGNLHSVCIYMARKTCIIVRDLCGSNMCLKCVCM